MPNEVKRLRMLDLYREQGSEIVSISMQIQNGNMYFVKFRFVFTVKELFFNLSRREIELKWNVINKDSNCGTELISYFSNYTYVQS